MTGWVDSLSSTNLANWEICKRVGMWGTPSNAGRAEPGDDLFLWKPAPDSGWLVHCRLTTQPRRVRPGEPLPWPDDRRYKYVMGIEVLSEPGVALAQRGAEAAQMAGLAHHVQLAQFGKMTDAGVRAVSALFPGRSRAEEALDELMRELGIDQAPSPIERAFAERLIAIRRGQGAFRQRLLDAFDRTCCISGSRVEATLEAAHIRPYAAVGSHEVGNGLLLRTDLHTLFDLHLVTVMPFGTVRVAPDLRGSEYEQYEERQMRRPLDPQRAPNRSVLAEHNAACAWLTTS